MDNEVDLIYSIIYTLQGHVVPCHVPSTFTNNLTILLWPQASWQYFGPIRQI